VRVVDPEEPRAVARRSTTGRTWRLTPTSADLVDGGLLAALCLLGLLGWSTTFDSLWFLGVGAIGLVLGIACVHVATGLRLPWWVGLLASGMAYFVVGGAVALRRDLVAGVAPSRATIVDLAHLAVAGWKHLLTTVPPVGSEAGYLVLPWLLGLVFGVVGYSIARATSSPFAVLLAPFVLFCLIILLSRPVPGHVMIQGLGAAGLAVGWAILRAQRRRRLVGTGTVRASRILTGTALVLAAGLVGFLAGPVLPGTAATPRLVLRTYVQPPIDVSSYPSPLPGFVKFASAARGEYFDIALLSTTGLDAGAMLRIAVLDQYTGLGWSASGTSILGSGFRRVGAVLPTTIAGPGTPITVTVTDAYAGLAELNPWIPAVGPSMTVTFQGDNAKAHLNNLGYDADKGQALVTGRRRGGATVDLVSTPVPWVAGDDTPSPGGVVVVPTSASDFAASAIDTLAADGQTPWDRLMNVGRAFAAGFWSDGSKDGEGRYLPGNGQGRLAYFFAAPQLVGSDEQYAAAFALAANRLGYPARVGFGARVPDGGVVAGKNIIPWVEIDTAQGWQAVPTELYIPDRNRSPEQLPPDRTTNDHALDVPPPRPQEPPGTLDDLTTKATAGRGHPTEDQEPPAEVVAGPLVRWGIYAGTAAGGVLLLVVLIGVVKALRTVRRRVGGSPAQRIAGGWQDMLDRARDLGYPAVGDQLTRREQSGQLGLAPAQSLAVSADRVMFSPAAPDTVTARGFWGEVDGAKRALMKQRGPVRRMLARVNPRSLASGHRRPSRPVQAVSLGRSAVTTRGTASRA